MNALVMCLANPATNPRPNRMIKLLNNEGYKVSVLGYCEIPLDNTFVHNHFSILLPKYPFYKSFIKIFIRHLPSLILGLNINFVNFAFKINNWYYGLLKIENQIKQCDFDIIVVEDLKLLHFAFSIKKKAKIIFDAREFYIKQFEENKFFKYLEFPFREILCKSFLHKCHTCFTVSHNLANSYENEFGVKMNVLRSTPNYSKPKFRHTNPKKIRMVHHGIANKNRKLENMIEIVKKLDSRFTLDFYLQGNHRNLQCLEKNASSCERIKFNKPVCFDQIIQMLGEYDIGFYYLEPTNLNTKYSLPNKFFEFLQGGLALAIGPSPDMKKIIEEYNCGFVSELFSVDSMVQILNSISVSKIDLAKRKACVAAKELCWEKESRILTEEVLPSLYPED